MAHKRLVKKLKNSKVKRDRRWVYNLVAWALENSDKSVEDYQRRINSAVYYAKGKYTDYWNNPRVKKQHKKSQDKLRKNNVKYKENSKRYNEELRIAYKLYKEGKLSKKSTSEIDTKIKEEKRKK